MNLNIYELQLKTHNLQWYLFGKTEVEIAPPKLTERHAPTQNRIAIRRHGRCSALYSRITFINTMWITIIFSVKFMRIFYAWRTVSVATMLWLPPSHHHPHHHHHCAPSLLHLCCFVLCPSNNLKTVLCRAEEEAAREIIWQCYSRTSTT